MAKLSLVKGTTGKILHVFLQNSASNTGAGLTGLTNASASLACHFVRPGDATVTAVSLVAHTLGTYTSSGFKEFDATNTPGLYEFCPPNTSLNSIAGANQVVFMFKGASNLAPLPLEIELTATDNQDGVHGGMTAIPNTAVTTNGSLITVGTGTGQISPASGAVLVQEGTTTGKLDLTSGRVGVDWAKISNNTAAQNLSNTLINTGQVVASVTGAVGSVTGAVGSVTGNVGGNVTGTVGSVVTKTGYALASTGLDLVTNWSTNITGTYTGNVVGSVNSVTGNVGGSVASVVGAVGSVTGNVGGNVTGSVGSVTGLTASDVGAIKAVTDKVDDTLEDDAGTYRFTANALEEAPSGGLDAAGVRAAVGLASANLDTQLDALPTANENADALLDRANAIETGYTPRQTMRVMAAALAGKSSGHDVATPVYRNITDSKDRITASTDPDGNRTAVTLDAS